MSLFARKLPAFAIGFQLRRTLFEGYNAKLIEAFTYRIREIVPDSDLLKVRNEVRVLIVFTFDHAIARYVKPDHRADVRRGFWVEMIADESDVKRYYDVIARLHKNPNAMSPLDVMKEPFIVAIEFTRSVGLDIEELAHNAAELFLSVEKSAGKFLKQYRPS